MSTHRSRTKLRVWVLAAALLAVAFPTSVAAHAELDVPIPADGATVEGSPPEVSGTFTQDLTVDGSSLQLRDAAGTTIAEGGVDPGDSRRMVIADLPELAPGDYEVRWTTLSAEDDEVDRDTWTFTVVAAPTASPTATPTATAAPTTSIEPSAAASVAPSASPAATPAGSDEPAESGEGTSDVLVPILAGLAIVIVAAALLLRRRSRPDQQP